MTQSWLMTHNTLSKEIREFYHQKQKYYNIFCAALPPAKINKPASGLKTH